MQIWVPICLLLIRQFALVKGVLPDKCKLPPITGKCKAFLQRIYYDYKSKLCRNFIYGGCKGNQNRFLTMSDCLNTCKKFEYMDDVTERFVKNKDKRCTAIYLRGWCYNISTRFYYDVTEFKCKTSNYHACGGDGSSFGSYKECVLACDVVAYEPIYSKFWPFEETDSPPAVS
ncbi:doenitin-1-like [Erythrolamprus reginae]|uniref:doenitin-1-like n=1 Tax=Erythrolamprus reginae TaxID=121349 RepID=UPI00396CBE65